MFYTNWKVLDSMMIFNRIYLQTRTVVSVHIQGRHFINSGKKESRGDFTNQDIGMIWQLSNKIIFNVSGGHDASLHCSQDWSEGSPIYVHLQKTFEESFYKEHNHNPEISNRWRLLSMRGQSGFPSLLNSPLEIQNGQFSKSQCEHNLLLLIFFPTREHNVSTMSA